MNHDGARLKWLSVSLGQGHQFNPIVIHRQKLILLFCQIDFCFGLIGKVFSFLSFSGLAHLRFFLISLSGVDRRFSFKWFFFTSLYAVASRSAFFSFANRLHAPTNLFVAGRLAALAVVDVACCVIKLTVFFLAPIFCGFSSLFLLLLCLFHDLL